MIKKLLYLYSFLLFSSVMLAHEIRPGYLEIKENQDHSLLITWKQPLMGEYGIPMHPSISAGWLDDTPASMSYTETYLMKRWQVPVQHAPLDKQTIKIDGLENTITDVMVQVVLLNDVSFSYLIKPAKPFLQLQISKPQAPPVWQYIQLGIFHIWSGYDHLLFVLGLLLLVEKRSRLIWTITSFTIAHSITLALATLQIVNVSTTFTEAAIALSIVFLAVELARHYRGHDGITYKYPWIVAFIFGLLHGLGFAGALSSVGLPQQSVPLALFLFNAGVEIGQLVFVFAVLLFIKFLHKYIRSRQQILRWIPVYAIGTMAAFWTIERISQLW